MSLRDQILSDTPAAQDQAVFDLLRAAKIAIDSAYRLMHEQRRAQMEEAKTALQTEGKCSHWRRVNVGTMGSPDAWLCPDCGEQSDE